MYTHNDSGSGPEFFMSDIDGSNLKRVLIENFTPKDTEDMAIANCFSNKTCLFYCNDI